MKNSHIPISMKAKHPSDSGQNKILKAREKQPLQHTHSQESLHEYHEMLFPVLSYRELEGRFLLIIRPKAVLSCYLL